MLLLEMLLLLLLLLLLQMFKLCLTIAWLLLLMLPCFIKTIYGTPENESVLIIVLQILLARDHKELEGVNITDLGWDGTVGCDYIIQVTFLIST